MKIVVSICVYNRFQNIQRWIKCWQQFQNNPNPYNYNETVQLVIIHNYYGDESEKEKYKKLCDDNHITYVPRNGQGFDIGAMQDVFMGRLPGFPDYDYLLWCCDDTIPMSKDFITPFIEKFNYSNVGISCMKISRSVEAHVRTTGFMISKEIASKIKFPNDQVTSKHECYLFEHRGRDKTLTNQVRVLGLECVQVAPDATSPLWDMGYWKRLDRIAEHDQIFGTGETQSDKVVFICPVYNMYPQIISSLLCQTHKNWELLLIHNGPLNGYKYDIPDDPRIKFIVYPEATGKWGHVLRGWALNEIREGRLCENVGYIVISNADNYHAPVYTEYLLNGFKKSHTAVASYCDAMVHNYKAWQVIPVKFERGFIDSAGVMVKKDIACEVGWRDMDSHSSDWTYFSDIASRYHSRNFVSVKGCLFVHN